MARFRIVMLARQIGAIGMRTQREVFVDAEDESAARAALYHSYEHISIMSLHERHVCPTHGVDCGDVFPDGGEPKCEACWQEALRAADEASSEELEAAEHIWDEMRRNGAPRV